MPLRGDAVAGRRVTVRAALHAALRGRAEFDRVVVITVAAPLRPLTSIVQAAVPGDRVLWDGRADGGWALAGLGETARAEANGPSALTAVRTLGAEILSGLREERTDGVDAPRPALLGGAAFDPCGPTDAVWQGFAGASFVLPRWVYGRRGERAFLRLALPHGAHDDPDGLWTETDRVLAALEGPGNTPPGVTVADTCTEDLSRARWDKLVDGALAVIREGAVEKLVVARRARVTAMRPFDAVGAVLRATVADPDVAGFLVERSGRYFLGATPERLVVLRSDTACVDALAGTAPTGTVGAPERLVASDKDQREHAVVVRAVRDALTDFCEGPLDVPAGPVVRTLRHVHHLWTPVQGRVRPGTHVLDLAAALHPTPAVAGRPREASVRWITANEPVPRGWYAGPVGWFDGAGEGALVVALRAAVTDGHSAWLYAGAGIVEGSTPAGEWSETGTKLRAMRAGLGAEP